MKKILLYTVGMLIAFVGVGQHSKEMYEKSYVKKMPTDKISQNQLVRKPNPTTSSTNNKAAYEEEVNGLTWYDLQTNASVMTRIVSDDNGNIATVWTGSEDEDRTWADRGSRYRFYNGTSWGPKRDDLKIETVRSGWPTILFPASGGEIVVSHQSVPISGGDTDTKVRLNSRPTRGTGNWTEKLVSNLDLTWPRATMGGQDGNSVHIIAVSDIEDSAKFNGLRRALVYNRSEDGGSTFNIQDSLLPLLNATHVGNIGGDNYAITASNDTVVIALFDTWNDVYILKSFDNGNTWTKTVAYNHPRAKIDVATDTFSQQTPCPDGSGSVLLGNDGTVHLFWGWIDAINDAIEPVDEAAYSFFGFREGLLYWNDTKVADDIDTIARVEDADLDGGPSITGDFPNYGTSLTSMPSSAQAGNGTIYVTYSSIMELLDDQGSPAVNYRHIYIMESDDNGASWSTPRDINSKDEFTENVYCSMNPVVGDKIQILFQRDGDPGVALRDNATDPQPIGENEIVYAEIDRDLSIIGLEDVEVINPIHIYPNPAQGIVTIDFNRTNPGKASLSVVSITGQTVFEMNKLVQRSEQNYQKIDVSNFVPGIYFVNIYQEDGNVVTEKLIVE